MRFLIAILILLTSTTACVKEEIELSDILLSEDANDLRLVIEGGITNEPGVHFIRLSTSGRYSAFDSSVQPVENAQVTVMAGDVLINYLPTEEPGLYATAPEAAAPTGVECTLTVVADEQQYTATDVLEAATDLATLALPVGSNGSGQNDFFDFNVSFQNFGFAQAGGLIVRGATVEDTDTTFYNRSFHEQLNRSSIIYTHSGASPQGIFPLNSRFTSISGDRDDIIVAYRLRFSDNYYDYLLAVFSQTDWAGGLFSTVPGNPPTNLSEGAVGYFYAIGVEQRTIAISNL